MESPLESPAESSAAVVYGGNTALDAEICDADCRRLNVVIKDVIEDHGLHGADKERAEEFTRKVGLSVPPHDRGQAGSRASTESNFLGEVLRCNPQHSIPSVSYIRAYRCDPCLFTV